MKIELNQEKLKKHFRRSFNSLNHSRNNNYKFLFDKYNFKIDFEVDDNFNKNFTKIIEELHENDVLKNNFPNKKLEKENLKIIKELHDYNKNSFNENKYYDLISNFEEKINVILTKEYGEYCCIFHIDNLNLKNSLTVGDVIFHPIKDDKECIKLNNKFKTKFFEKNKVYAFTKITGLDYYVYRKSYNEIKLALNIIKLFLNYQFCNFNIDGSIFQNQNIPYILSSKKLRVQGVSVTGSIPHRIYADEKINTLGLDILSRIMYKKSKTEFEKKLLTSIYWIGEAKTLQNTIYNKIAGENNTKDFLENLEFFELYPIVVYLVIALETSFVFDSEHITTQVIENVTNLISKKGYESFVKKFISNIYNIRSKIVHTGTVYISQDDIKRLMDYTVKAMSYLIEGSTHYHEMRYLNKIIQNE